MPYDEPEFDDPHELLGVELPGDETVTYDMAAAFAEEFAQLGYTRPQILALFRKAEYAGAHQAWTLLGEAAIARLVDESVGVWGRFACVVTDSADDGVGAEPLRFITQGAHGAPARERSGAEGPPPRATEPGCGAEPHVIRS